MNMTEKKFNNSLKGYYYFDWPWATKYIENITYYEVDTGIYIPAQLNVNDLLSDETYYVMNEELDYIKTTDERAKENIRYYISLNYKISESVSIDTFTNNKYCHQNYMNNGATPAIDYNKTIFGSDGNLASESEIRSAYNIQDLLIMPKISYEQSDDAYSSILDCKEAYMKLIHAFGYEDNSFSFSTIKTEYVPATSYDSNIKYYINDNGVYTVSSDASEDNYTEYYVENVTEELHLCNMNLCHTKREGYNTPLLNNFCNNLFRVHTLDPNMNGLSEDRNITDFASLLRLDYGSLSLNSYLPGITDILNFNLNSIDTGYIDSFINELAEITVIEIEKWHNDYLNNAKLSVENDWKSIKETLSGMTKFKDVYEEVDKSSEFQSGVQYYTKNDESYSPCENLTQFDSNITYYTLSNNKWATLGSLISNMSSNIWTCITHSTLNYNVIPNGYGITNAIATMYDRAKDKSITSIDDLKYIEFVVVLLYFISNEEDIDVVRDSSARYEQLKNKLNSAYQDAIAFRTLYFYFLDYIDANTSTYHFTTNKTVLAKSECYNGNSESASTSHTKYIKQ